MISSAKVAIEVGTANLELLSAEMQKSNVPDVEIVGMQNHPGVQNPVVPNPGVQTESV